MSGAEGNADRSSLGVSAVVAFVATPVVCRGPEEGHEFVATRSRIRAAHLDELTAECTIEQQVACEVSVRSSAHVQKRQEAFGHERIAPEASSLDVFASEAADVFTWAQGNAVDVAVCWRA